MMFLRITTQWNVTMGGYVGLRYEVLLGAKGLLELYDVDNPREMLEVSRQRICGTCRIKLRRKNNGK